MLDIVEGFLSPGLKSMVIWDLSRWRDGLVEMVVDYKERTEVGYRWFSRKGGAKALMWWLGFGLVYTTFELSNLILSKVELGWEVTLLVKNVGVKRVGK